MKKMLLVITVVCINLMCANAQILTIDQDYHQLNFLASDYETQAISFVQNNSSITRNLRWVLSVESEPAEWSNSVCDNNTCYAPGTLSKDFALKPDSLGLIDLNLFPFGVAGNGNYSILIYDIDDSANANVTMTVVASAQVTGISNIPDAVISFYPIPAKDILNVNLNVSKHISSIEIYNVVGQKIKELNIQDGLKSVSVPVSDMKKGVYFLRVISGGKEITTRTFSKD